MAGDCQSMEAAEGKNPIISKKLSCQPTHGGGNAERGNRSEFEN